MKLKGREIADFVRRPDKGLRGALLYGADPGQVSAARQSMITALLGPDPDPFALTTINGEDARRDAALLGDECAAMSLGVTDRVVICENAGDGAVPGVKAALEGPGGAFLIVTAGALAARSKLRALFEKSREAACLPFYPVEDAAGAVTAARAVLDRLGAPPLSREGAEALGLALAGLSHGEIERFAEVLALHAGEAEAIGTGPVTDCAPPRADAALDDVALAVAGGGAQRVPDLLSRLDAQGLSPHAALAAVIRHLTRMHAALCAGGGAEAGAKALRPPVFFKLMPVFLRDCRAWGPDALERALLVLAEAEAGLRQGGAARPDHALVERALMRAAMLRR